MPILQKENSLKQMVLQLSHKVLMDLVEMVVRQLLPNYLFHMVLKLISRETYIKRPRLIEKTRCKKVWLTSTSFFVRVALQSVPGHPEAKNCQNLIRTDLLEAILETSRPASKPASQAQPLGRVFSTKRTRGQDRRVFRMGPRRPNWTESL